MKKTWLYVGFVALIAFAFVSGVMIRRATTAPAETIGERLRKECESIVDAAYPLPNYMKYLDENDRAALAKDPNSNANIRFRESRIKQCIVRRGELGR